MYEAMRVNNGKFPIDARRFSELMWPMVVELHRTTPRERRPDPEVVAGLCWDALEAAGVEAEIGPPLQPHGH
jgi:hypothetical protein